MGLRTSGSSRKEHWPQRLAAASLSLARDRFPFVLTDSLQEQVYHPDSYRIARIEIFWIYFLFKLVKTLFHTKMIKEEILEGGGLDELEQVAQINRRRRDCYYVTFTPLTKPGRK